MIEVATAQGRIAFGPVTTDGHDKAVPDIAEHIRKFWDPRMRKAIFAHLDTGSAGLDPYVRDAIETRKQA
jgi:formate dehydrogenase subunit delta